MARFLRHAGTMLSADMLLRVQDAFDKFVGPEIRDEVPEQPHPRHGRLREWTR